MKREINKEEKKTVKKEVGSKDNSEVLEVLNKMFICIIVIVVVLLINTIVLVSNRSKLDKLNDARTFNESSNGNNGNNQGGNQQPEAGDGTYDISKLEEITAANLVGKTQGTTTVVYIGRSTCGWCVTFSPVLNDAIDQYGMKVLYIDIAKILDFTDGGRVIDQAAYDILMNLDATEEFKDYMNKSFGATPMLLIMKDGQIVDAQTGYSESIDSILDKNGYSKK